VRKSSKHDQLDEQLPDSQASPHVQAEQREELRAVLARLQELPEIDRAALLMRSLDGLACEEIAQSLGISLASVKVRIHRARLALSGIRNK